MTTLKFRLLGPLEILSGGERLPNPATLKSQSLLAYLITHRQRPQPRDRLAGMFWGDRPERKARSSLSTALWHVRRCLPAEDFLVSDRQSVQADPEADLWVDVDAFVARASQEHEKGLQLAVALYRGDFLDGLYDDWIINERYRLQALFAKVLERLMHLRESKRDPRGVLSVATRLLRQDPLRENAHRAAMRAYCQLGRRNAALEQYARCQDLLRQELDAEHTGCTTALYRKIRSGRFAAVPEREPALGEEPAIESPLPPGRSPLDAALATQLVGRESELKRLRTRWQRAAGGAGGLMMLSGEAGVGKTRLAKALADRVRWKGGRVLWGRCYEFARGLPYQPFSQALSSALPTIAPDELRRLPGWVLEEAGALVPELSEDRAQLEEPALSSPNREVQQHADATPVPESSLGRGRLFEAVTRLLVALTARSPLLLVLEDLHWAADATIRLLNHLARRLPEASMLALGTYRPAATVPPHPLRDLERRLTREELVDLGFVYVGLGRGLFE